MLGVGFWVGTTSMPASLRKISYGAIEVLRIEVRRGWILSHTSSDQVLAIWLGWSDAALMVGFCGVVIANGQTWFPFRFLGLLGWVRLVISPKSETLNRRGLMVPACYSLSGSS